VSKITALVCASLLFAACGGGQTSPARPPQPVGARSSAELQASSQIAGQTGAPDARVAVAGFLTAAKKKDLKGFTAFWGSVDGSVRTTGVMNRKEMEKRELVMFCYLEHQSSQIVGEAPSSDNELILAVQLRRDALTRTANFYAVAGPAGRWYVRTFDMEALTPFCIKPRS
jgi:hypothetical protein